MWRAGRALWCLRSAYLLTCVLTACRLSRSSSEGPRTYYLLLTTKVPLTAHHLLPPTYYLLLTTSGSSSEGPRRPPISCGCRRGLPRLRRRRGHPSRTGGGAQLSKHALDLATPLRTHAARDASCIGWMSNTFSSELKRVCRPRCYRATLCNVFFLQNKYARIRSERNARERR